MASLWFVSQKKSSQWRRALHRSALPSIPPPSCIHFHPSIQPSNPLGSPLHTPSATAGTAPCVSISRTATFRPSCGPRSGASFFADRWSTAEANSLSLWGGTSNCGLPLCAVLSPKLVHPLFCSEELGITGRSSRHQLRTRRTGQDSADSAKSMLPTQPRRCGTFGTDGQTQRSSPSTWHLGLSLGTWCHRGTSKREEATTVQPCAGLMGRLPSKVRPYTL